MGLIHKASAGLLALMCLSQPVWALYRAAGGEVGVCQVQGDVFDEAPPDDGGAGGDPEVRPYPDEPSEDGTAQRPDSPEMEPPSGCPLREGPLELIV